jgi:hypothetical protein
MTIAQMPSSASIGRRASFGSPKSAGLSAFGRLSGYERDVSMFSYFASKAKVGIDMSRGSVTSLRGEKMVVVRAASWRRKTLPVSLCRFVSSYPRNDRHLHPLLLPSQATEHVLSKIALAARGIAGITVL